MNNEIIVSDKTSTRGKLAQIEKLFDGISKDYDFLNRLITFLMDKKWRHNVLQLVKKTSPHNIVDVATGLEIWQFFFQKRMQKALLV